MFHCTAYVCAKFTFYIENQMNNFYITDFKIDNSHITDYTFYTIFIWDNLYIT